MNANPSEPVKLDEPDSELRKLMKSRELTAAEKYMWLTVGQESWSQLVRMELLVLMFSGIPGAAGIFLRQKFYRKLFRHCGKGVVFGRNVTIRHPHRIEIGDGVVFDDNVVLDAKGDQDTTIRIGDGVIIGRNSILACKGGTIEISAAANISVNCTFISESRISIGEKTLVAGHCYIIGGGNHGTDLSGFPFVEQPRLQKGGILIHHNCWIGAHATLLDGATIGPDTIVGAASLVNGCAPPKSIVVGAPARVISRDAAQKDHSIGAFPASDPLLTLSMESTRSKG